MTDPKNSDFDNRFQEVVESEYDKARFFIRNIVLVLLGCICGGVAGYLLYKAATPVYEARANFLIDQIPFVQNQASLTLDNERQLVQTMILSVPSSRLGAAVAKSIGANPDDLAFLSLDRPLRLKGTRPKANISVEAIRDSRIGQIIVSSQSSEFAVRVGDEILNQPKIVNQLGGELIWLNLQSTLAQRELEHLMTEQTKLSASLNELERQASELADYTSRKLPLESFHAFATDTTLDNLKTQLILVESEYENLAHMSVGTPRLEGKRAEVESLKSQITEHASELVSALKSQLDIVAKQLKSTQDKMAFQENEISSLKNRIAQLTQSYGNPAAMQDVLARDGAAATRMASCIIPVQQATAGTLPVRPKLWLDLLFGMTFGAAVALGASVLLHYIRLSKIK